MRRPRAIIGGGVLAIAALTLLLPSCGTAGADDSADRAPPAPSGAAPSAHSVFPPFPRSLGQPPSVRVAWGTLGGYNFDRLRTIGRLNFDVERPLFGSKLWWLGGAAEAAARMTGPEAGGAVGVLAGIPWLYAGPEYRFPDHDLSFTVSFRFPLRRGGLLGQGDLLRLDYRSAQRELLAGLTFPSPFERYRVSRPGRTALRPPAARIPGGGPGTQLATLRPETEHSIDEARHAVLWLSRLLTPHFEPDGFAASAAAYREHIRLPGHTFEEEDARYHAGLDSAFASALDGSLPEGRRVAALAESILFRDVVVAFNRSFGQERVPAHAGGYCARALAAFQSRLADEALAPVPGIGLQISRRAACAEIFRQVLITVREASAQSGERWRESFLLWSNRGSLAWVPLNYGLRPGQYDTQGEWDTVLSEVTGEPFTDANRIEYLMMEQFHLRLKRMIRETRYYQVTIVHDFRGRTPDGRTDLYGWDIVVDGYMAAFREAIRELDAGTRDRLPQFYLFLDANYYQARGSRGIMTFLENLTRPLRTGFEHESIRDQIEAAQDSLIRAIRRSPSLAHATEREIRDAFRVHVSVTNPFDPAFVLDITRRDHRKVGFRDVFEEDPGSGEAIFTGQGIGEHYNGTGWEDRGIEVRGSALVQLKSAARELLIGQGLSEREIPQYLQPRPFPPNYAERCVRLRADGWTTPVSIPVNETGYGAKDASVLKAAIYNLAPRGSYLLSYDSLWSSEFWAGMFVSAALRGANMLAVGPVPANAPSAARPTLHYLRQNLRMMIEARAYFAEDLARGGGMLRAGLYAHDAPTSDFRRREEAFQRGRATYPFLREVIPTHPSVDTFLVRFAREFSRVPQVELRLRPRPLLHMKCQLFGTAEAFQINGLAEWSQVLAKHLQIRKQETFGMGSPGITPAVLDTMPPGGRRLVDAFEARLDSIWPDSKQRVIFTFTIGSHNQNPRSLLLDGEDLVAVSGYHSAISIIDMAFILCVSEWPADVEDFDRLFHPVGLPFYLKPFNRVLQDQG